MIKKNEKGINVRVINACGFWGREVGKLAGLDLPLVPVQHQVQHHHLALVDISIMSFLPQNFAVILLKRCAPSTL